MNDPVLSDKQVTAAFFAVFWTLIVVLFHFLPGRYGPVPFKYAALIAVPGAAFAVWKLRISGIL